MVIILYFSMLQVVLVVGMKHVEKFLEKFLAAILQLTMAFSLV